MKYVHSLVCSIAVAGGPMMATAQPPAKPSPPKSAAAAQKPGYLGIFMQDDEEGKSGATVREVPADSPAGKAGLRVGDSIVELNGKKVDGPRELADAIKSKHAGDKLDLKVLRDGREEKVAVILGERPKQFGAMEHQEPVEPKEPATPKTHKLQPDGPRGFRIQVPGGVQKRLAPRVDAPKRLMLGVQLQNIDDDLRKRLNLGDALGVLVAEVVAKSPAEKAGVKAEDVIIEVDGKKTEQPTDLTGLIASKKSGDAVKLKIVRAGKPTEVTVKLEEMAVPGGAQNFRWRPDGTNPGIEIPEGMEKFFSPENLMRPRQEVRKLEEQVKKLEAEVKRLSDEHRKMQDQIDKLSGKKSKS